MEQLFIYLNAEQGGAFINLYQIAYVNVNPDDSIVLHTTDGHNHHIRDKEDAQKMICILAKHAVTLDGNAFSENPAVNSPATTARLSLVTTKPPTQ